MLAWFNSTTPGGTTNPTFLAYGYGNPVQLWRKEVCGKAKNPYYLHSFRLRYTLKQKKKQKNTHLSFRNTNLIPSAKELPNFALVEMRREWQGIEHATSFLRAQRVIHLVTRNAIFERYMYDRE